MTNIEELLPGPTKTQLGGVLRELRLAQSLELDQLAALSDVAVRDIDALERGQHRADVATLRKVASGLGIRVGLIFGLCERQSMVSVH